jgi:ribosomal-protein-alanine N-acetyltransferase
VEHKGTVTLDTDRLVLRRFTEEDAEAMFRNWASDEQVTKYLTWPTHQSVDTSRRVLRHWIGQYQNMDFYQWAIVLKGQNDEPIGGISVVDKDDRVKLMHVGYCLGRKWWNQGIMTEAFSAVITFLFEEVKANRIEARFDPNNLGSGRVMEKCGLRYEGTLRQADYNNQGIVDVSIYGLLASEYYAAKQGERKSERD